MHPEIVLLRLQTAYENGTIERVMKRYGNYELLIIDEIGYLPIQRQEADLLFQLINLRYERHSTIFTTNSNLSGWSEIFRNPTASAAILDRLVHHSQFFKITGKSYRLRDYQGKPAKVRGQNRLFPTISNRLKPTKLTRP